MSTTVRVTPAEFAPPGIVDRFRTLSMVVGALFAAVAIVVAALNFRLFLQTYLVGFMFWLGVTLGSLALLMLQYTSGGQWGVLGRRFWEAATRTLPLMFLFWLPLAFGMKVLYPWATMKPEELVPDRAKFWLNPRLFVLRAIIYFVLWIFWAWWLRRWSEREERGDATPQRLVNVQNFSGAGIVMYGLTITFASVDWVMSLNPMWWSTVWGMLFMVGECLTTFAFTIWLLARFSQIEPLSRIVNKEHFHDYGKLMFAFVILWAYLSFAQWLIIWQGNITEEIRWYLDRAHGHWKIVAIGLIFFHFVLPFAIMLSRNLKRQPRKLVRMAMWIMIVRLVDLFWLVQPSFHSRGTSGEVLAPLTWQVVVMNIVNVLAIGGLWLTAFYWQLGKRSLMPVNDPEFIEVLEAKHGHG
ncbi:MAG TPA: hypothetical protein VKE71_10295 [Candidatus Angelobacter sp.]|nr:hypothetical protein [Candidatus Angelobacter sp.]